MTKHFLRELEQLKRDVLVMGGLAEAAVTRAVKAFQETDVESAQKIVDGDAEINAMELRIEEEVLKILSLYGPTAKDLRFVVGVHKITNDLERVGDLAVNIAERAKDRDGHEDRQGMAAVAAMAERVREMLGATLDAFVSQNIARAHEVLAMDDSVDELLRSAYAEESRVMQEQNGEFAAAVRILATAKYLERIADHCTNIAEDVIYMVSGDVVKHQH